ncbi:MAG: HIT family protein [Nanoarchaeota archaeon]|nr:HIT family protein [Nanoarchaeota archaeon]
MTNDCIFCKIANKEIPSEIVWENDNFLAFADIKPIEEGHTLVIPKKHFDTLPDLEEEISKDYLDVIKKIAKILIDKYNADGFNIVLNNGKSAGQIVNHVHFHIIPRKEGDNKKGLTLG